METTLHRQLKDFYCNEGCEVEVKFGRYRIDVVDGDRLIEIQHSGLAAIRQKIQVLLKSHKVDVIKPIIAKKTLVKLNRKHGEIASQRLSPKRGGFLDLIDELLYFTRVFPNKNLRIIAPRIEIEEIRYPGHGKRRRKRAGDFVVQDRVMMKMLDSKVFQKPADLFDELPRLPKQFDTKELADAMSIQRWQAQRVAYVLKHVGSINPVGKRGNAILYSRKTRRKLRRARKVA